MCYDKTDYRIIRYPEKEKWKYQRYDGRIYMRRRDRDVTELKEIIHILDSGQGFAPWLVESESHT